MRGAKNATSPNSWRGPMAKRDPIGELISGILVSQFVLIRLLEERGTLQQGDYREALEAHLENIPDEQRNSPLYAPMKLLIKKLAASRRKAKPH